MDRQAQERHIPWRVSNIVYQMRSEVLSLARFRIFSDIYKVARIKRYLKAYSGNLHGESFLHPDIQRDG